MSGHITAQHIVAQAFCARNQFNLCRDDLNKRREDADVSFDRAIEALTQEINHLREQSGIYQQHMNDMAAKTRQLEMANAAYVEAHNQLQAVVEAVTAERARLANLAETRSDELNDLEARYAERVDEYTEIRAKKQEMESSHEALKWQVDGMSKRIEAFELERDTFAKEKQEAAKDKEYFIDLNKELKQELSEAQEREASSRTLNALLSRQRIELSARVSKLEELCNKATDFQNERQNLHEQISKLKKDVDARAAGFATERRSLEEKISQLDTTLSDQIAQLASEKQMHRHSVSKLETDAAARSIVIENERQAFHEQISELSKNVDDRANNFESKRQRLQEKILQLDEDANEKAAELESERIKHQQSISELEREVANRSAEFANEKQQLQQHLSILRDSAAKLTEANLVSQRDRVAQRDEVSALQNHHNFFAAQFDALRQQYARSQQSLRMPLPKPTQSPAFKALEVTVVELRREKQELADQLNRTTSESEAQMEDFQKQAAQIKALNKSVRDKSQINDDLRQCLRAADAEVVSLRRDLRGRDAYVHGLKQREAGYLADISSLRDRVSTLEEQLVHLRNELSSATRAANANGESHKQAEAARKGIDAELRATTQKLEKAKQAQSQAEDAREKALKEVEVSGAELLAVNERLAKARRTEDATHESNVALVGKVDALEGQLRHCRSELPSKRNAAASSLEGTSQVVPPIARATASAPPLSPPSTRRNLDKDDAVHWPETRRDSLVSPVRATTKANTALPTNNSAAVTTDTSTSPKSKTNKRPASGQDADTPEFKRRKRGSRPVHARLNAISYIAR